MTQAEAVAADTPAAAGKRALGWLWPLLLLALVGAAGLTSYIADELAEGESFRLDSVLLLALRQPGHPGIPIGPPWLEQTAIDLSALGGFTVLWLLGTASIGFLTFVRRRTEAACIAGSLVGATVLNLFLKSIFHRARPDLTPHLATVSSSSFPSGHAMVSAAVYLTIAIMLGQAHRRAGVRAYLMAVATVLVFLIGCSRVFLGVHWPSDVLVGWSLGAVWALAVYAISRQLHHYSQTHHPKP